MPLLARQHDLELPQCADLFGQRGLGFLRRLQLKNAVDQKLLEEDLDLLGLLAGQIKGQEERIKNTNALDADTALIQSLPGMGPILAAVAAAEINGIERFPTSAKLCAYAGLIPSTHASGGTVYHGRLVKAANKSKPPG